MKLAAYIQSLSRLERRTFAARLGISQGYLSQLVTGTRQPSVPNLVGRIVKETGGRVKARDLRPDVY